eukprot:5044948-Pleurochrysis_carterae.AAC.1
MALAKHFLIRLFGRHCIAAPASSLISASPTGLRQSRAIVEHQLGGERSGLNAAQCTSFNCSGSVTCACAAELPLVQFFQPGVARSVCCCRLGKIARKHVTVRGPHVPFFLAECRPESSPVCSLFKPLRVWTPSPVLCVFSLPALSNLLPFHSEVVT